MRARKRLGMERIELDDEDIARIDALGDDPGVLTWLETLDPGQREAISAHVVDERSYREIAEHGLADSVFLQRDLEQREEMARL